MSDNEEDMYCGIKPVPKGKIRGTAEYCVQTNQIRYYGLKAIDKNLLETAKGKSNNLIKEQLKLKKLQADAKILIKEVKNLKIILESDSAKQSEKKAAQRKVDALLIKRDKLVKNLEKQVKNVKQMEKERDRTEREERKASKSSSKSNKSSKSSSKGSKKPSKSSKSRK